MTRLICRLCLLSRSITIRDSFVSEEELAEHVRAEHPSELDGVPIKMAEHVAMTCRQRQVIILAWDGEKSHVATWGKSLVDADQAAQGGNLIKDTLRWPPDLRDESQRVVGLVDRINALLSRLDAIHSEPNVGLSPHREIAAVREFLAEHWNP